MKIVDSLREDFGCADVRMCGCVDVWMCGFVDLWNYGYWILFLKRHCERNKMERGNLLILAEKKA